MKKFLLSAFLLTFALIAQAQKDSIEFANAVDGKLLKAAYINLNKIGYGFSLSPDRKLVAIKLLSFEKQNSGNDELCLYDLQEHKTLWTQPMDSYSASFDAGMDQGKEASLSKNGWRRSNTMQLMSHGLLLSDGSTIRMYDTNTGKRVWKSNFHTLFTNDGHDAMMGYKTAQTSKLSALQLSSGKKIWEQKVPHLYNWGWDNVLIANDTSMMVVNNNINFLNPLTGRLQMYKARVGYEEVGKGLLKGLAIGLAAGMVGGLVGVGPIYMPYFANDSRYVDEDAMTYLYSNIYVKDGRNYVSDRDSLYCFDSSTYKKLWSYGGERKAIAHARLFSEGDTLFLLNYGYGLEAGYKRKKVSRPFIASFNIETGKMLHTTYLAEEKRMLVDAVGTSKGALMAFNDALAYQAVEDTTLKTQPWNASAYGAIVAIPKDTIYTFRQNDEVLTPLYNHPNRYVIITDKNKMLCVNKELSVTDDYSANNIYRVMGKYKNFNIVGMDTDNGYDMWIVRKSGQPVARINKPVHQLDIVGDKLFLLYDKGLVIFDMKML